MSTVQYHTYRDAICTKERAESGIHGLIVLVESPRTHRSRPVSSSSRRRILPGGHLVRALLFEPLEGFLLLVVGDPVLLEIGDLQSREEKKTACISTRYTGFWFILFLFYRSKDKRRKRQ